MPNNIDTIVAGLQWASKLNAYAASCVFVARFDHTVELFRPAIVVGLIFRICLPTRSLFRADRFILRQAW